jgi:hypothetical protein
MVRAICTAGAALETAVRRTSITAGWYAVRPCSARVAVTSALAPRRWTDDASVVASVPPSPVAPPLNSRGPVVAPLVARGRNRSESVRPSVRAPKRNSVKSVRSRGVSCPWTFVYRAVAPGVTRPWLFDGRIVELAQDCLGLGASPFVAQRDVHCARSTCRRRGSFQSLGHRGNVLGTSTRTLTRRRKPEGKIKGRVMRF